MSFLNELQNQKKKLKVTETVVTKVDGQRYIENSSDSSNSSIFFLTPHAYGFVEDTQPDDKPVMINNHLYIGSQDCATEAILNSHNIKNVVSVGVNIRLQNFNHIYIPCLDIPETDITPVLRRSLPFICNSVKSQQNVLVHCNAGVSRTGLVTIAYLMYYENKTFENAYFEVRSKRPCIQPNIGFIKQLQSFNPDDLHDNKL